MESAFPCRCPYGATRMRLAEADFFAVAVDEEFAVGLADERKAAFEIVGKIIDAGGYLFAAAAEVYKPVFAVLLDHRIVLIQKIAIHPIAFRNLKDGVILGRHDFPAGFVDYAPKPAA